MNLWLKCSRCSGEYQLKELIKELENENPSDIKGIVLKIYKYCCPECRRYFTEFYVSIFEGIAEEEVTECVNCGSRNIWTDSVYVGNFPDHPMGKSRYQVFVGCRDCGISISAGSIDR